MRHLSDAQADLVRRLGPDGYIVRTAGSFADQDGQPVNAGTVRTLLKRKVLVEDSDDTLFPGVPSQVLRVSPFMRVRVSYLRADANPAVAKPKLNGPRERTAQWRNCVMDNTAIQQDSTRSKPLRLFLPASLEEICEAIHAAGGEGEIVHFEDGSRALNIWLRDTPPYDDDCDPPDAILGDNGRLGVLEGLGYAPVVAEIERRLCAGLKPQGRA